MKKLRKLLAIVMVMALLMSALPMVSVGAEEPFPVLSLDVPTTVRVGEHGAEYVFTPERDGWYRFSSVSDTDPYIRIYDTDWKEIDYVDDYGFDDYNFVLICKLNAGDTYFVELGDWEGEDTYVDYQVYVEETVGVESVEITQQPYDNTCIEGFEYETIDLSGLEATFTLSDGSIVDWSYDEGPDDINDLWVYVDCYDDGEGNFYYEISCGNALETVFLEVVESPVQSIEFVETPILEYYENTNGYYDEVNGCYYYYYDIPEDLVVIVNYKDGGREEVNFYDLDESYIVDNQYDTPWTVGDDNYITIGYLGAEAKIPVVILPCPFVDVTVNSVPNKEYVFGDREWGEMYEGEYCFYPDDLTGLEFTVEYADGTKRTFTDADIDMDNFEIDGYEYYVSEVNCSGSGTYEVTLSYLNYDITYSVEVLDSPIASIEIIEDADRLDYEVYYYPVLDGIKLKVTLKDGTEEIVELTKDNVNLVYDYYGLIYYIDVLGYPVYADYVYDEDVDGEHYKFSCLGATEDYYGFSFSENRELSGPFTVENFTPNGEGMVITVNYKEGTEETLHFTDAVYDEYGYGECEGFAYTENGIAYYWIGTDTSEDGDVLGYYVYFLGEEVYVEVAAPAYELGDVDGDGEVSIMDATAIQMHEAELMELSDEQLACGDVDYDDVVTVMDATKIQMFVAQLIEEL